MEHYTAEVEAARRGRMTPEQVDRYMDALAAYSPTLAETPRGNFAARLTIPADSIRQAAQTALAVAEDALGDIIRLDLMTEEEADAREGDQRVPDLIGVTAAAAILDVSPQRIRQMIEEGKIAAHRVGDRAYAIVKSEVLAKSR